MPAVPVLPLLQPPEFEARVENTARVVSVRYVICNFFQLFPAVAHGDTEEGFCEHGNVVHAVAENDDIFERRF